ncbi:Lacal_2735 family protein [Cesiribacter andamanensis]|nr:Lacal_2735 family protein [Cesiribacter andamanensis]
MLAEAHALSHTNRRASDQKAAEADEVARRLEQLG